MESDDQYRKLLRMSAAAMLKQAGFDCVDERCMHLLIQMLRSLLMESARSARCISESHGRSKPVAADVVYALSDMGLPVHTLPEYVLKTTNQPRLVVPPPKKSQAAVSPQPLHVGVAIGRPDFVPDYLPAFPDAHTYKQTQIECQSADSYMQVRDARATQNRNTETGLADFMLRIMPNQSIFPNSQQFRVITPDLACPNTVSALLASNRSQTRTEPRTQTMLFSHQQDNAYSAAPQMPPDSNQDHDK